MIIEPDDQISQANSCNDDLPLPEEEKMTLEDEKRTETPMIVKRCKVCFHCGCEESNIWRKFKDEHDCFQLFCNDCCVEMNRIRNPCYRTLTRNRCSVIKEEKVSTTSMTTDTLIGKEQQQRSKKECEQNGSDSVDINSIPSALETYAQAAVVRKSTRSKRNAKSGGPAFKNHPSKGKGRRHIFKQFVSISTHTHTHCVHVFH